MRWCFVAMLNAGGESMRHGDTKGRAMKIIVLPGKGDSRQPVGCCLPAGADGLLPSDHPQAAHQVLRFIDRVGRH